VQVWVWGHWLQWPGPRSVTIPTVLQGTTLSCPEPHLSPLSPSCCPCLTCLGRTVHISPSQATRIWKPTLPPLPMTTWSPLRCAWWPAQWPVSAIC
jgi:hypothetical protein